MNKINLKKEAYLKIKLTLIKMDDGDVKPFETFKGCTLTKTKEIINTIIGYMQQNGMGRFGYWLDKVGGRVMVEKLEC